MCKNSVTINFTRTVLNYITAEADALGLKKSPYVESVLMTYAFTNGFTPTAVELENLRNGFLVNGSSNLTGIFRRQISSLSSAGQMAVIAFFYRLNLISGFKISTRVMANLYKEDELCYFALGEIGRNYEPVNAYLKTYSLTTSTIGNTAAPDNEYLFFSNYQQFKVKKAYPKFAALLSELNLAATTEVIRVHYSELMKIADAISMI